MSRRPVHPDFPGREVTAGEPLGDVELDWPVVESNRTYANTFIGVREDTVQTPDGAQMVRTVVEHQGAVGVVAVDDDDRILLLRQYRHPVGRRLLEIPAGILDVPGERAADTAARELAEETDLVAQAWSPLVELYSSPGFTDEHVRLFVASGLSPLPASERAAREHEEADMDVVWVPLSDAVTAVLDRRITNSLAVAGILALAAARR